MTAEPGPGIATRQDSKGFNVGFFLARADA